MYEIANELYAPDWQYEMIDHMKRYEKTKPKQHLVLMSAGGRLASGGWRQMSIDKLFNSPADCFAVAGSWESGRYRKKDPPANNTGKPAIVDMDHVAPGSDDVAFVWSAFTRGYHFNLYDKPFESPDAEGQAWERIRYNVGKTVEYANKVDLVNVRPRDDFSSTRFCLAKPPYEYIVYQPGRSSFTVSGLRPGGLYYHEWYDPGQHEVVKEGQSVASSSAKMFAPANKNMVLYLKYLGHSN
jgi:hypothetical protein